MAESKATAPDFVMTLEVDMDEAVELRAQLKAAAGDGPAPSFNDFVIKAAALALRDFPRANGAYRDGQFELYSRVNIGVAVAGQDALVVPTVFDADRKSLGTIAAEARRLAERVREGKITPPELSAGTFTISNLGMYGIRRFVAVINPPQAAILAVGELSPKPVVRDGEVVVGNRWSSRSRATTASSTAPTRPSSWRRSASTSRPRCGSRSSAARSEFGSRDGSRVTPAGDWSVLTNRHSGRCSGPGTQAR